MPTVLCIEDHPAVLEHALYFLERVTPRLRCVTAGSGREGLALARAHTPEVVLLDLALPDGDGLELIEPLRNTPRAPAIMVYTGNREDATLRRLEGLGIAGLLWKGGVVGADLVQAVEGILAGETYLSPKLEDFFDAARLRALQPVARPAPVRERIVVVKAERLRAETIARAAREACPDADVTLCHTAAEAAASLRAAPAALGLFGLNLPDRDGLDLLDCALRERWLRRIIVVTARQDSWVRHRLKQLHVDGIFDSGAEVAEALAGAIRRVGGGERYLSASWQKPTADERSVPFYRLLTQTEHLIFALIATGMDDAGVCARFGIGLPTLHTHRHNIKDKLDLKRTADFTAEAVRCGVVRFTAEGLALMPGLDEALAARMARSRDPFGGR